MNKRGVTETITGYVGEAEDEDGLRLALITEEEDFVIEMNKQGQRLMRELDSRVVVTGVIKRKNDGSNMISISKFEILDDDEDDHFSENGAYHDDDDRYDDDDGYDDEDDAYEDERGDRDRWME